jgi:hypothetical protein
MTSFLKSFSLGILLLASLGGHAVSQTVAPSSSSPTVVATEATFDPIYWAHQPSPVAALAQLAVDVGAPSSSGRTATAIQLATAGYQIDVPIDINGWDAFLTMQMRQQFGYTWVPALLQQPVCAAPGLAYPGCPAYNPNSPPAGSITVSLNIGDAGKTSWGDYPPFNPPAPVVTAPQALPTSCVGISVGAGYYTAIPACGATLKNGQTYSQDPRGPFVYHTAQTPFATTSWFTSVSGN